MLLEFHFRPRYWNFNSAIPALFLRCTENPTETLATQATY